MTEVHKKFEGRGLFTAMEALKFRAYTENVWTAKMEQKYNALDKEATDIMLAAESKCLPKTFGAYVWTQDLADTGLKLRYIMLNILEMQKGNIPDHVMEKARERSNSTKIENKTEEELQAMKKEASLLHHVVRYITFLHL